MTSRLLFSNYIGAGVGKIEQIEKNTLTYINVLCKCCTPLSLWPSVTFIHGKNTGT